MKNGHATAHARSRFPVPNRFCKGGKASSIHKLWLAPAIAMKIAIHWSEKPKPPSEIEVYWKTGAMAV